MSYWDDYESETSMYPYATARTTGTTVIRKKATVVKADKSFDFTDFNQKTIEFPENVEITELNKITDEVLKKGLLKTVIAAGNGVFELVDSKYGYSIAKQTGDYAALGPSYPSLGSTVVINQNPAPKLPRKAIESVIEWYRRITEKNGQEAQVNFYHNFNKATSITIDDEVTEFKDIPGLKVWSDELFSYTPLQNNSSALTSVASNDPYYDEFNRQFGMYIETHSHNSMDAFASSTDEDNSTNDGHQLVFGRLNTANPIMYSWTTANNVLKLGMSLEDLNFIMEINPEARFDQATDKLVYKSDSLEFDEELFEEWDKQVVVRTYPAYSTYSGYTGGAYARPASQVVKRTTYGNYGSNTYARVNENDERKELEKLFETLLAEKLDNQAIEDLVLAIFMAGYETKANNAYVYQYNLQRLLDEARDNMLDALGESPAEPEDEDILTLMGMDNL